MSEIRTILGVNPFTAPKTFPTPIPSNFLPKWDYNKGAIRMDSRQFSENIYGKKCHLYRFLFIEIVSFLNTQEA